MLSTYNIPPLVLYYAIESGGGSIGKGKWKDGNGTLVSMDEALSDPKCVLSSWIIEMYRLWRQRDGTWHVVWVLNKARVAPAPAEDETGSKDEIDDIEW